MAEVASGDVVSALRRTRVVVSGFSRTGTWIAFDLVACVLAAGAIVGAQQRTTPAATLTPQDYIDIQQLVSNYPYGLDGNTDNGATYASLFAPGAVFGRPRTEGRDNLAALANREPHGANYVRHFITNHVIEPSPGGAIGREYAVIIDIGENGKPGGIALGGRYDDEYVKTPQGWKFKNRTFTPSRVDVQPAPAAGAARGAGRGQQ
jgi:SnoaL-like protein